MLTLDEVIELPAPPDVVDEAGTVGVAEAADFGVSVEVTVSVGAALTLGGAAEGEEPSMVREAPCAVYVRNGD